ncbi:MAG: NrfD/PsrC family molybdoenzyme membrane anchor subunit, partial [Planctomycetota bacterium]
PQPKSWLVKGAFVLIGSSLVAGLWGAGLFVTGLPEWAPRPLGLLAILAGAATTGYTAFLFAQAKGRQLWQSPLLLPHLVIQGLVAGSAALSIAPGWTALEGGPANRPLALSLALAIALVLNGLCVLGELTVHPSEDAKLATSWLKAAPQGMTLTLGVFGLGHLLPLGLLSLIWVMDPVPTEVLLVAGPAALVGLWIWEHLYVQAGQVPPLS